MLDKLIDFILGLFDQINPFFIVSEYQQAVVLRNGKFLKLLKNGLHLKAPFIDEIIKQHTITTTLTLPAQSLVTKDGFDVVIKGIVKYKIFDIKIFCLEVFDNIDAISDISQGIIKTQIMNNTWDFCTNNELDNLLSKKVRHEVKKYGVEVEQVTLTDIAKIRTIKLINETTNLS